MAFTFTSLKTGERVKISHTKMETHIDDSCRGLVIREAKEGDSTGKVMGSLQSIFGKCEGHFHGLYFFNIYCIFFYQFLCIDRRCTETFFSVANIKCKMFHLNICMHIL